VSDQIPGVFKLSAKNDSDRPVAHPDA
jgi:hypothetical protein